MPVCHSLYSGLYKEWIYVEVLRFAIGVIYRADGSISQDGLEDINSDLATAIRTSVILFITWGIVLTGNNESVIKNITGHTWAFLVLSGVSTGPSLLFCFKAFYPD